MENLLFILLIAVAGLLKWLADKASESKEQSQKPDDGSTSTTTPLPRAPAQSSEEERVRKFLEALGVPTSSPPPPPVAPKPIDVQRAADEARRRAEELKRVAERKAKVFAPKPHIPPLTTFPPPIPAEQISPPSRTISVPEPASVVEEPRSRARKIVLESPVFEVGEVVVVPPPLPPTFEKPIKLTPMESYEAQTFAPAAKTSLSVLLASQEGRRQAIILSEIFGAPRSLRSLDDNSFSFAR